MGKRWLGRYGLLLAVGTLVLTVLLVIFTKENTNGNYTAEQASAGGEDSRTAAEAALVSEEELYAVWVPYFSLQMSGEEDQSAAAFQAKFDGIVESALAHQINTLIVQVRPFADAFYPSALFPWSACLTGIQGADPGYDPLAYMVQAAHDAGLLLHAWVNPLRVQGNGVPDTLAETNPARLWMGDPEKADWCLACEETDGVYLNPGVAAVRQYIADGVGEIVKQYDVDGVQFDDYFYPTTDSGFDAATYQAYCDALAEGETALPQAQWRRENVNALIALVYRTVKEADPTVAFGVSPQGNVENDEKIGADVTTWCSAAGYVDYICPQLYYNFENPYLPYDEAASQWRALVTNPDVKLYFGLGLYKVSSDADEGTWKNSDRILARQITLGRELGCDGFALYSCEQLESAAAEAELANVMEAL